MLLITVSVYFHSSQIFEEVEELVASVVDGFNVAIFAYGQTGSGKTHTMEVCMCSFYIYIIYIQYIVCVCVCVCACVRACVRACVCVGMGMGYYPVCMSFL